MFLLGAAAGIVIMQIRQVGYLENEDRMKEDHRELILNRIDSGYYALPDGDFYLNGDSRNAYYRIKDGTIQLFADDDQLLNYYYAKCASIESRGASVVSYDNKDFTGSSEYESSINRMKAYIAEPADYILDFSGSQLYSTSVKICAEVLGEENVQQYIYDKEQDGGVYIGGNYVNENVFEFDECVWIRL